MSFLASAQNQSSYMWATTGGVRAESMLMYACKRTVSAIYINNPLVSLPAFSRFQLNQMCPFPESFLRTISSAMEFRSLPTASSTTGGPIIPIPYGDGEWEGLGDL